MINYVYSVNGVYIVYCVYNIKAF
ncbi:hypothetical protein U959_02649, partial [Staphylococcus aureus 88088-1]